MSLSFLSADPFCAIMTKMDLVDSRNIRLSCRKLLSDDTLWARIVQEIHGDHALRHAITHKMSTNTIEIILKTTAAEKINNELLMLFAVQHGQTNVVKLLLKAGYNKHMNEMMDREDQFAAPMMCAIKTGKDMIVAEFIRAGWSPAFFTMEVFEDDKDEWRYPLQEAIINGFFNIVVMLVKANADIEAEGANFLSPLCEAVRHGRVEIVDYLLRVGCDVERVCTNCIEQDVSPLWLASSAGNEQIVARLIRAGADINEQTEHSTDDDPITFPGELWFDYYTSTPLWVASSHGHVNVVQMLLEAGSDLTYKCKIFKLHSQITPWCSVIEIALKNNHLEVYDTLLRYQSLLRYQHLLSSSGFVFY